MPPSLKSGFKSPLPIRGLPGSARARRPGISDAEARAGPGVSLWPEVAGGIRLEHAGNASVFTDVGKGDGERGPAAGVGYVKMEVGHHAVADVAALRDDLPLFNHVAHLYAAAVFSQVKIAPQRAIIMLDGDEVVGPVVPVAVVPDDNPDHFPAAGSANFRADRQGEVIGKASRAAVTDDPSVALDAAVRLASGPGKAISRSRCRGRVRDIFGAGSHTVTDNDAGEQSTP